MVGMAALMRVVSPTTPSFSGTLKSTRHEDALAVDIDVADGLLGESHDFYLSLNVSDGNDAKRRGREPVSRDRTRCVP